MDRREFLKLASVLSWVLLIPGQILQRDLVSVFQLGNSGSGMYLPLQGSPFRKSCDGLTIYDDTPFEVMSEDIIHFRMAPKWRDRIVLGIGER